MSSERISNMFAALTPVLGQEIDRRRKTEMEDIRFKREQSLAEMRHGYRKEEMAISHQNATALQQSAYDLGAPDRALAAEERRAAEAHRKWQRERAGIQDDRDYIDSIHKGSTKQIESQRDYIVSLRQLEPKQFGDAKAKTEQDILNAEAHLVSFRLETARRLRSAGANYYKDMSEYDLHIHAGYTKGAVEKMGITQDTPRQDPGSGAAGTPAPQPDPNATVTPKASPANVPPVAALNVGKNAVAANNQQQAGIPIPAPAVSTPTASSRNPLYSAASSALSSVKNKIADVDRDRVAGKLESILSGKNKAHGMGAIGGEQARRNSVSYAAMSPERQASIDGQVIEAVLGGIDRPMLIEHLVSIYNDKAKWVAAVDAADLSRKEIADIGLIAENVTKKNNVMPQQSPLPNDPNVRFAGGGANLFSTPTAP